MAFYLKRKTSPGLSLATTKDLSFLLWIADQKGFFTDEKIRVRFKTVPYAYKAMELLMEGQIDCSVMVETNVAYLGYLKPKIPIKCFASIEQRIADNIILRHAEGEKPTPADLKGKRVGFKARTTSHSFLFNFLEHYGISRGDIELKDISPQVMASALIRGEVDAISCWQPFVHNAVVSMKELGIPCTVFPNTGFYASEVTLATTKPFLVKNRELLRNLLKAIGKAENYMKTNREDVMPLLIQKMRIQGRDHEEVWRQYQSHLSPVGPDYLRNIEQLGRWIREKDTEFQKVDAVPDYSDFMDNSLFFDKVRMDSV